MKNILSKVIASSMALTLVLASAVTTTSSIKTEEIPVKAPAAVHETVKPAAAEEEKGLGLIEAIEQKAVEEAVVEVVKAAPEIKEEKAAPEITEEKAAPVVETVAEVAEEVAAPAAVIEEAAEEIAAEAEPVKVWDVSATENDNVSMKFYADNNNNSVYADVTTGEVIISGTGAMEEAVYTNFMSVDSYLAATKVLFEDYYGVEVELVYDDTITDVLELERNLNVKDAETGEELDTTDEIRENINPADFLEFSPTKITIEEGITSVSAYAFLACADLVEITLPKSVKGIDPSAFQYCTGLEKVTMHEDTFIGTGAFYNCTSLTTILRLDDAGYANMANGMSAEAEGAALTVEEVNALVQGA